ncbi:hypothetical protein KAU39_02735 [bacterium]|nr:hypothetical protein [bacterium]
MKTKVGVWIDHRKAVIVFSSDKGEEIKLVKSNIAEYVHPSHDSHSSNPFGKRAVSVDDVRERDLKGHLNLYYDEVISYIRNSESILIFGSGEAKGELKKRMERKKIAERIVGVETEDKMSDRQIASKVRKFFSK